MMNMFGGTIRRVSLFLSVALLAVLLSGAAAHVTAAGIAEVGAADLLKMIRAERGKVVVINFFASWCPPCKEEIPDLIALRGKVDAADMTLIGVSVDEVPKELEAMTGKYDFNYPIYRAVNDLPEVFAISSIPRLLIYDRNGTLVIDHIGLADPSALTSKIEELKAN